MPVRLFLFLAFFFLLCTSREPPWADAHVVYDTTQSLLDRGRLDITLDGPPWFFAHRDGRKYGAFPLGNVVAMVPSYLAYRALLRTHLFPGAPLFALCSHLSPALLMALAGALCYRLCRRRGAGPRLGVLLALSLGLGTLCLCYARSSYSEALQTAALLLLVERTLSQGDRMTPAGMAGLGAAAGVLFNSKLVYALLLPLAALYLLRARRETGFRRGVLVAALAFAPFLAVALWHNHLKTGSPWQSGYQIPEGIFSGDLLPGLYGFLLSTGKSMFLYSPPLLLGLLGLRRAWRGTPRERDETLFLLSIIAVVLLFNARFRAWHGDYCWGPRYLTPITPLGLLLGLPWLPEALSRGRVRLRRAGLALLLLCGLFVQLLGAAFYWDFYIRILIAVKDRTGAGGWFKDQLGHAHYMPQFSPIRGHLWLLGHVLRKDPDLDRDAPWKLLVPQPANLRDHYAALRVDLWAIDWFTGPLRAPRAGAGLLLFFAGGTLLSGLGLARRLRREAG